MQVCESVLEGMHKEFQECGALCEEQENGIVRHTLKKRVRQVPKGRCVPRGTLGSWELLGVVWLGSYEGGSWVWGSFRLVLLGGVKVDFGFVGRLGLRCVCC